VGQIVLERDPVVSKDNNVVIDFREIQIQALNKSKVMRIYVVENLAHPIILGRNWLHEYNPHIDWRNMVTSFELSNHNGKKKVQILSPKRTRKILNEFDSGETKFDTIEINEIYLDSDKNNKVSTGFESKLNTVLSKYTDVMTDDLPNELPPQRSIDHRIELTNEQAFPFRPTYRLSIVEMQALKGILSDMIEKKWIRPSTSPYGAPVMLVSKKDGKYRMVIDYRQLNNITIKNRYPLPRHDELMAQLHGAKIFSKIDLKSGYYQIRMDPKDVHKTAFNTRWGHYEFLVLPQGLTGSPGTFMGLMNSVFKEQTNVFVIVFMDDILIYSKNEEDHVHHIEEVFKVLRANKLYAST